MRTEVALAVTQAEGDMNQARDLVRECVKDLLSDPHLNALVIKKLNRVEVLLKAETDRPITMPWLRNPKPGGTE